MNHKILETLEFSKIRAELAEQTVTETAAQLAHHLQPSCDYDHVHYELQATEILWKILRNQGQLPLVKFKPIQESLRRLRIKAELNAQELGNLYLILSLARDNQKFLQEAADKADLSSIQETIDDLTVSESLLAAFKRSLEYDGTILDSASSQLLQLRRNLQANEAQIQSKMQAYTKGQQSKYLSEAIVTVRDGRYVIPVKQENRGRFGGVVHDQSASGQTLFIEPEAVLQMNNLQQALLAQERQEIRRILQHLSHLAAQETSSLAANAQALVQLDFLQAKAQLARKMQATKPEISQDYSFWLVQARHPLIDPQKVVANDISLGINFDSILITGPNTGGKTITLKTAGLLQVMAQAGLFIPAKNGSKIALFREIFADIGDEQSIEQSLSTFSSHINDIIAIMKQVDQKSLVLIDEIGAGTDPEEGASLAIAILNFLQKKQCKIMVTTHYPELKLYGYNRPRTTNASMEFDIKSLAPTYHLQIGIPGQSNAFAIARRLGMREDVVQKAQGLVSDSDSEINQMIIRLNEQTKKAATAKEKLETALQRSEKLEKKLQDALDIYQQRVQKQLDFAQQRANEIVHKKRRQADKIIAQLQEQLSNSHARTDHLIAAKGEFNALERESQQLAQNKVLQREKRRHHVQVGNQVKVLSYGQVGQITKKLAAHEYEVQLGIMKVKVSDRDIEKIGQKPAPKRASVRAVSASRRQQAHSQLDLRGQRYEEAMVNLDRYFDSVLLAGLDVVTIVHGIGTGAIRNGVWQYLKKNPHVQSFNYAPANQGGTGATIVHLK